MTADVNFFHELKERFGVILFKISVLQLISPILCFVPFCSMQTHYQIVLDQ